ncbi:MAG: hypothetical protein MZV49_23815 [Rhodopseudomonas palustris]|nr:hypothetical protein [Rhodopseudomonas palustris]
MSQPGAAPFVPGSLCRDCLADMRGRRGAAPPAARRACCATVRSVR